MAERRVSQTSSYSTGTKDIVQTHRHRHGASREGKSRIPRRGHRGRVFMCNSKIRLAGPEAWHHENLVCLAKREG